MPEYLTPGVFVEEVPSAVKPIAGVGTSTAGFVGIVQTGVEMPVKSWTEDEKYTLTPEKVPERITSYADFTTKFGKLGEKNKYLAHAVYGFFNNGGTACWVTRVAKEDDYEAGLDTLKARDEVAIVAVPGAVDKKYTVKILAHCEAMKDRVAIIDGTQTDKFQEIDKISGGLGKSTGGYGAIYFPWLKVENPGAKEPIKIPPSGHIAGIYARSDATRGVHKAPANEVIRGVLDVEHRLINAHQDALNPGGINVIRAFNGSITVWGARTWADYSKEPEWKYVSTRRLMNYIRESIEDGTRWVVFESNDMGLWQKIRRNITAFLTNVWRSGALFGAMPEQAFYVKCDAETNPAEVREQGQVVTEIGVAIVKPAEFVIFRISQSGGQPS